MQPVEHSRSRAIARCVLSPCPAYVLRLGKRCGAARVRPFPRGRPQNRATTLLRRLPGTKGGRSSSVSSSRLSTDSRGLHSVSACSAGHLFSSPVDCSVVDHSRCGPSKRAAEAVGSGSRSHSKNSRIPRPPTHRGSSLKAPLERGAPTRSPSSVRIGNDTSPPASPDAATRDGSHTRRRSASPLPSIAPRRRASAEGVPKTLATEAGQSRVVADRRGDPRRWVHFLRKVPLARWLVAVLCCHHAKFPVQSPSSTEGVSAEKSSCKNAPKCVSSSSCIPKRRPRAASQTAWKGELAPKRKRGLVSLCTAGLS